MMPNYDIRQQEGSKPRKAVFQLRTDGSDLSLDIISQGLKVPMEAFSPKLPLVLVDSVNHVYWLSMERLEDVNQQILMLKALDGVLEAQGPFYPPSFAPQSPIHGQSKPERRNNPASGQIRSWSNLLPRLLSRIQRDGR